MADEAKLEWEMEQILDELGTQDFLEMLISICYQKAEHARSAWQDEEIAEIWESNAEELSKVALKG